MHRSWVEIDSGAVANNLQVYRAVVGKDTKIMVMVKADAYGHGAVDVGRASLEAGADRLGVATCLEGMELREAGINCPVQVLGALLPEEVELAVEHNLIISIHDLYIARVASLEAIRQNRDVVVHVKLDTGMGRLGFLPEKIASAVEELKRLPRLKLEGMFMHMAEAVNPEFTASQLERFEDGVRSLAGRGFSIPLLHVANSNGALKYPEAHYNMIRPGIGMYGVLENCLSREKFPLRHVMSWRAHVIQLKDYPAGCTLGYAGTFVTKRRSRIAILPVGYADGYKRAFSNTASVIIGGSRAPVVGRISMDYTMVDVSDLPEVCVGCVATLIGEDNGECISAEELSKLIPGCIPHEIFTGIGKRVGHFRTGEQVPGGINEFMGNEPPQR